MGTEKDLESIQDVQNVKERTEPNVVVDSLKRIFGYASIVFLLNFISGFPFSMFREWVQLLLNVALLLMFRLVVWVIKNDWK